MLRLVKIHAIFLVIALFIAFALVPADLWYFDKASDQEISSYYNGAISLENLKAWKIVFIWFLGLTCGRLIIRALMSDKV